MGRFGFVCIAEEAIDWTQLAEAEEAGAEAFAASSSVAGEEAEEEAEGVPSWQQ